MFFLGGTLGVVVGIIWLVFDTCTTRTCPHCLESIKREAHVCKHCGREVVGTETPTAPRRQLITAAGGITFFVLLILLAVIH